MIEKCKRCKKYEENADCADCQPDYKTSNADRIRSMSDEELAEYLSSLIRNGHEYLTGEGDWRQWLQSEAE